MKYTVILNQSVPADVRMALTEQLSSRFGLSADQAEKLAGRKPGRLLKPTGKARAEALLALYRGLNLNVQLEEVADDATATAITPPPVAAPAATPVTAATPAAVAPTPMPAPAITPVSVTKHAPIMVTPAASPTAVAPRPAAEVTPVVAASAEQPAVVIPSTAPTVERTFVDEVPAAIDTNAKTERRFSLRQRILFTTLAPLLIAGAASLAGTLLGSVVLQVALTVVVTGVAAFFAVRTGRELVAAIEHLVQAADKISLGQLETPVVVNRNDEIGDLAQALERMRLSLEAAMERLRKRRNRA